MLPKSKCDTTQKLTMQRKKHKNSKCYKTQIETKLKNSKWDKTQNSNLIKHKNPNCDKT